MAFHVEIKRGFSHARAFNLDEARLRREVVDPWLAGDVILLGDQEWEPKKCTLKVLEGPELHASDLGQGRGWDEAEKTAENVTRRVVAPIAPAAAVETVPAAPPPPVAEPASLQVAIVADSESAEEGVRLMLGQLGIEPAPWPELRARLLAQPGGASGFAAVIAIETGDPPDSWLFDAGLARGALGSSAVFAQFGDGPIPSQLAGVEVMRLEASDQASLGALKQRLGV